MKVSSSQQASIKSIILLIFILALSTVVAAVPASKPPSKNIKYNATTVYGGCTGTFGDIQKSSTGGVEAYLTIVCDVETVVTVDTYYMAIYTYYPSNSLIIISTTSPSPLAFTVSPGTSAVFIVPGAGCYFKTTYYAFARSNLATFPLMADVEKIKNFVKAIPDFPKEGIIFRDIFPIFRDPSAVEALLTHIAHHVQSTTNEKIDVVLGLDARGFLFGPLLALRLHASFAPIRKKGKLPGSIISAAYTKEYGVDEFEIQADAIQGGQNVIIIDDLIATGGSAYAAKELVEKAGGRVVEFVFVIELVDLKGRDKLGGNVYSVIQY
ncbi:2070_t:CDS:2 [Paraglomus brasilianum]|uniref:adenine phosphoribosyltransferase n=1 Tax=Paraglomus brasilianum TaxID=144538 RepID=A0A9N9F3M0_9GLOM|nr:2070_t:CDS:2 [Paraglomus brasilianum]